ncbi:unnamed protein product [Heterobilharzia americana]|nr:unnamed protein product [Heterobilharzia americana]
MRYLSDAIITTTTSLPFKSRDSSDLGNRIHQHRGSSEKISSAASEAALHRRRLNELRQSFLGLSNPESSHYQTVVSTCISLNADKRSACTEPTSTSGCSVLNTTEPYYGPSLSLSTPDIGYLSFFESDKLHGSVSKTHEGYLKQSLLSTGSTVACDQLDTTDQLPSPEYVSFAYSNHPTSHSECVSTGSSLYGTVTVKPTSLISKINYYPLAPETVHLSSEEYGGSSSSSNTECSNEYVVSGDNLSCPKSSINIGSLTDVKWLSEQCRKDDIHSFPYEFPCEDSKRRSFCSKHQKISSKYRSKRLDSTSDNLFPTSLSSPTDNSVCNRVNTCNHGGIQSHYLCSDTFCFTSTGRMHTYGIYHQNKCESTVPDKLALSTTNAHNDDSQLHSPTKSVIGRFFSVSPNHRLSDLLPNSQNSLNNSKVVRQVNTSKKGCVMNNSRLSANNAQVSGNKLDNPRLSSNFLQPCDKSDKKKMSSESLSVSDIQDIYLRSYVRVNNTSEHRKQRSEKGKQMKMKSDHLHTDCFVGNQDTSDNSDDSVSDINSEYDKIVSHHCKHEQPPLCQKQIKPHAQNSIMNDVSRQNKQLFPHVHPYDVRMRNRSFKSTSPGLAVDHSSECSLRDSASLQSHSNRNSGSRSSNLRSSVADVCQRLNSGLDNNGKNTSKISGSSSYQSFSPPYVNMLPPTRSSDLSSSSPSSENVSSSRDTNKVSRRTPRLSSGIQNLETNPPKSTLRHNCKPVNKTSRVYNPLQLSKGSCIAQHVSESSSTLSVNDPTDMNVYNVENHFQKYDIQTDDRTQEYDCVLNQSKKISALAAKISHYLENGEKPKHVVDKLIRYCGNNLQKLLNPNEVTTLQDLRSNSTCSLLHLAASLSDLRTSYMPEIGSYKNVHSRRRGSCGSVTSNPLNTMSYGRSWAPAVHNWSTLDRSYELSPFQGKSISSLHSSNAVRFIKWPSNGCIESRPPPLPPPPLPLPPVLLKTTILPCDQRIQMIDANALEVTNRIHTTFSDLISDLTTGLESDVEVVRSLYRWTTGKDIRFEDYDPEAPPDSLIGMLRQMKYNQLSRNEMFYELCRFVGFHCQYITGYSKGAGYRPGMPIKENRLFRNTWLAVFICDGWRFVNCNWGARYLTENILDGRSTGPSECDDVAAITQTVEYKSILPLTTTKITVFQCQFISERNYSDCLITKNGQVSIKIKMSKFVGISCSLENCADHSILNCPYSSCTFTTRKYYLNVYVSPDWRREDVRELACSFQIHCSEYNYSRLVVTGRLPEVGFLGRTPASQVHGVIMVPEGDASDGRPYIVHNDPRPLRIPFAIAPGLKLCHQLKSFDRPGHQMADCDSYALLQMKPNHQWKHTDSKPFGSQANGYYSVRLPVQAFYYLTIYASNENDVLKDHLECVYRILIDARSCRSSELSDAYPRQTFWWVHCRLVEPTHQHLIIDRSYKFCLDAPHCDSVAVVINESEWHFLSPSSPSLHSSSSGNNRGRWSGKVYTGKCLGQLSVFGRIPHINKRKEKNLRNESSTNNDSIQANYDDNDDGNNYDTNDADDENSYIKLLDYILVQKEMF